jgi:hypothetical protein
MGRVIVITALLLAALGLAGCGGDDDGGSAGQGDPKCFGEDGPNGATCTSSEGVVYRVFDRDATGTLGKLSVRLADGPRPAAGGRVDGVVQLLPRGPYDGDVSLQQKDGKLFIPDRRVRKGDRLELSWKLPEEAIGKLYEYPSYLTFFQEPAACPGGKAQCFVYIRLWK